MCSQGRGERCSIKSKAWWMVLSGQIRKFRAGAGEFVRGREHEFGNACPVSRIDVLHIFCERVRVQGDFRMIVLTEELRAFERDAAVAERGSFGAASDDADVERHFSGSCQLAVQFS